MLTTRAQESRNGGEQPPSSILPAEQGSSPRLPVEQDSSPSTLQGSEIGQVQGHISQRAPDSQNQGQNGKPLPIYPSDNGFSRCTCKPQRGFRHKDSMGRTWVGPEDDRYLDPCDGRLKKLVVQTAGDLSGNPSEATWERRAIRNVTPRMLRIVCWTYSSIWMYPDQRDGKDSTDEESSISLYSDETKERIQKSSPADDDWSVVCIKWLPACVILFLLLFIPTDLNGEVRNNCFYEKFRYRYWGYSKIPRNPQEGAKQNLSVSQENQDINPVSKRPLHPRYLCFLNPAGGATVKKVEDWASKPKKEGDMRYIFVSYTSEQFLQDNEKDMESLHNIAQKAAKAAQVPAYWIACSCMPDKDQLEEDVHRISDVVRGAHSLSIVVGPHSAQNVANMETNQMLRQWGKRVWTFPEVLLSPGNNPIAVYTRDRDPERPLMIHKRNFAALAWEDAAIARQLVDHYESSIHLTPLELISLALRCLQGRETTQHFEGDMAYALMGLLRRRPKVDDRDTAFQAFARLSLANDSNKLLERLICILPKSIDQQWHTTDDAWDINLWDIDPICQVAGIGEDDTVILSGAFAAPIRWKSFAPVALLTRNTVKRWLARICLRGAPGWFVFGVFLLALGSEAQPKVSMLLGFGGAFLALALASILVSPYMLRSIYMGKSWGTQPWFFGFEGHLDIGTIEANIFGVNSGRLTWSPFNSELSRHYETGYKECIGIDPVTDPNVRAQVQSADRGQHSELKVFTLVDTYTMTVTMFRAVRPPVAVLLCGSEGGMQRAVMCSYDWRTQTLFRETVLRMKTLVLEKMSRVDNVRLGLQRPPTDTLPSLELHSPMCPEGARRI